MHYTTLHAEEAGGVEAGGVVIWDGGLAISRAERLGCLPVGGEFWFDWAGVMAAVEDGFNVSRHREFAGALDVIPF